MGKEPNAAIRDRDGHERLVEPNMPSKSVLSPADVRPSSDLKVMARRLHMPLTWVDE